LKVAVPQYCRGAGNEIANSVCHFHCSGRHSSVGAFAADVLGFPVKGIH